MMTQEFWKRWSKLVGVWVLLGSVLFLAFSLLLEMHCQGASPFWTRQPLQQIAHDEGFAYIAPLGRVHVRTHGDNCSAQILEDGVALLVPNAPKWEIQSQGEGQFLLCNDHLVFSTSDNSDPRINLRKYEIYWPVPIPHALVSLVDKLFAGAVVLAMGSLFVVFPTKLRALCSAVDVGLTHWRESPWNQPVFIATAIFCVSLAIRVGYYQAFFHDPTITSKVGFSILGSPYSDARSWVSGATSLAQGTGLTGWWSAIRPFYSIFLAFFYTWFGTSHTLAIILNLAASALTVSLLYLIGEIAFNRTVGICTALLLSFDGTMLTNSLISTTETLGLLLFVWSVYALLVGLKTHRLQSFFISGILFGLSNLTRPLSLFAFPGFLLCMAFIQRKDGTSIRKCLLSMLVCGLGLSAVLMPWLIRQKVVHGIFTISSNTAACLYAATEPRYQTWSNDVEAEPANLGIPPTIKDRYDYFMRKTAENLRTNPPFFIHNAVSSCWQLLVSFVHVSGTSMGLALFVVGALSIGNPRVTSRPEDVPKLAGFFVLTGLALVGPTLLRLAIIGAALGMSWYRRRYLLSTILANSLFFSIVGIGVFGMAGYERLRLMIQWQFILLYLFSAYFLGHLVVELFLKTASAGEVTRIPMDSAPSCLVSFWPSAWLTRVLLLGQIALVAFFATSGVRLVYLTYFQTPATVRLPELSTRQAQATVASLNARCSTMCSQEELTNPAQWYMGSSSEDGKKEHGRLFVARGTMQRFPYHFPEGVRVFHGAMYFKHRDYERTLFLFHGVDCRNRRHYVMALLPGHVPDELVGKDAILVGRVDAVHFASCDEGSLVEGIALLPCAVEMNDPNGRRGVVADEAKHWERLSRLRRDVQFRTFSGGTE